MRYGMTSIMPHESPNQWAEDLAKRGFTAAYFPAKETASDREIFAYEKAAKDHNLVIAEMGIWKTPFAQDSKEAEKNKNICLRRLEIADAVGAKCCVNVSGAAGEIWYAYYPENYSEATYWKNVEFVQWLLDTAKPKSTYYALEIMPWMLPDSAESYLKFLWDVNRDRFAVHFDPVNLINSVEKVRHYGDMLESAVIQMHPYIKSCHLKDFLLTDGYTPNVRETIPGRGWADLSRYLKLIHRLDPQMPMLFEHLHTWEDYEEALAHVQQLESRLFPQD